MDIAQSNTREKYPLSTRKILKKTLVYVIVFGILGLFCLVFSLITLSSSAGVSLFLLILALLVLLVIPVVYWYQRWYFAVYYYDLTNDYIVIRKGPITPSEISIPYERIQDVYVDQDLLDRILGLYDVHLSSATVSSGESAHIDGVEKQAADGLRAVLLDTVKERISKHRGPDVVNRIPTPPAP